MRPTVGRDDSEPVVRLDELEHRLRSLDDLTNQAVADKRRRANDARDAPQRRIVLVAERLRLCHGLGFVQTSKRLSTDALTLSLPVDGGRLCRNQIVPGPPDASHVRVTISSARNRLGWRGSVGG